MLSDLKEWSHWDHDFPPTLGQILNQLEGTSNDLSCFVLRSGKVEDLFVAVVKHPTKKMETQIVSIMSLYGSTHHTPTEVTCQVIDILVKNYGDYFDCTTFIIINLGMMLQYSSSIVSSLDQIHTYLTFLTPPLCTFIGFVPSPLSMCAFSLLEAIVSR